MTTRTMDLAWRGGENGDPLNMIGQCRYGELKANVSTWQSYGRI